MQWSITVEMAGKIRLIDMSTTILEPAGAGTKDTVTTQLISLVGDDMINRAKVGHNASLDNLVEALHDGDEPFTQGLALGDLDEGVTSAEPDFVDPFPGLGDCGMAKPAPSTAP
jgi:hypothetical protein